MNAIVKFYDQDQTQRLINRYDNPNVGAHCLREADGSRSNIWLIGFVQMLLDDYDIRVGSEGTPKMNAHVAKLTHHFTVLRGGGAGHPFTHVISCLYRTLGEEGKLPDLHQLTIYVSFPNELFNPQAYPNADIYGVDYDTWQFTSPNDPPRFIGHANH